MLSSRGSGHHSGSPPSKDCWYPRTAQRGHGWRWVVRVLSRCRRITALASTDFVPWQTGHMAGELLTSADAAKALNITPLALQRWVTIGAVTPTLRLPGGHFLWHLDDLKQQLREASEGFDGG